jgi:hypothetical protein
MSAAHRLKRDICRSVPSRTEGDSMSQAGAFRLGMIIACLSLSLSLSLSACLSSSFLKINSETRILYRAKEREFFCRMD